MPLNIDFLKMDEEWLIDPTMMNAEQRDAAETFIYWYDEWTHADAPPLVALHSMFEECNCKSIEQIK